MKKEYLILILIIVILAGYLILKKEDRRHYTLPDIPAVDTGTIDRLTLTKKNETFEFTRTSSGWVVTDNEYPADSNAVDQMLDVLSKLTLSALVSEKQDVTRYELDESHGLTVTAFQGDTPALSFKIGKTAPTHNHTFVMLQNDTNIYQARDSFRSHFSKSLNEYRDRRVLTFQENDIQKITIQTPEKQVVLTVRKPAADDEKNTTPDFNYEDGTAPDPTTVSNLLYSLSNLTCERFIPDMDKALLAASTPNLAILLENDAPMVLKLFEQDNDAPILATSSMNNDVFSLLPYIVEDITSYAHDLAGITRPDTEETEGRTIP